MPSSCPESGLVDESATVRVNLLDGGSFSTADMSKLHANAEPNLFRLYDWCFHVFHPGSGRHILWDVGISSDRSAYTPMVLDVQWESANPVGPQKTLHEQLEALDSSYGQIDTVIFSHAHWDHCRPIQEEFPKAKGLFGGGTKTHCSPGHLDDGVATSKSLWDGRFFDSDGYASENWAEITGEWKQFGPFERALDFFGDGSFMIIDAPGHMPGNLAAAARLSLNGSASSWILLASDCCHSRQLLNGQADFAFFDIPGGKACLHEDVNAAEDTIRRLREAEDGHGMHIAMAHDVEWLRQGSDEVLMSVLPTTNREQFLRAVRAGEAP
ncbi:uncharacterized protein BDZ99DRAFT_567401 [Mytilinidion resinicola]|uniref:Metallo-hydrolase/oxidoreductase n=1 Tax=Mytilinidion resinicola TaxID=574789 RepID=A0A6A6Z5U0_9PEZI|nr:uncharacterized protein BDZ99DRAFT_567401 [Mytilinidion resinicola]KAF2815575.1 hypothetical protein BDZ99DRAFT_567401 [Mytilinidion resinicola]